MTDSVSQGHNQNFIRYLLIKVLLIVSVLICCATVLFGSKVALASEVNEGTDVYKTEIVIASEKGTFDPKLEGQKEKFPYYFRYTFNDGSSKNSDSAYMGEFTYGQTTKIPVEIPDASKVKRVEVYILYSYFDKLNYRGASGFNRMSNNIEGPLDSANVKKFGIPTYQIPDVSVTMKLLGDVQPPNTLQISDPIVNLKLTNKTLNKTFKQHILFKPDSRISLHKNKDVKLSDGTIYPGPNVQDDGIYGNILRSNEADLYNKYTGLREFEYAGDLPEKSTFSDNYEDLKVSGNSQDGFLVTAKIKSDNTVTVKFVVGNDAKNPSDNRFNIIAGDTFNKDNIQKIKAINPMKDNATFKGWYLTDKDGNPTEEFDPSKAIEKPQNGNTVIYHAVFEEAEESYFIGAVVTGLDGKRTTDAAINIEDAKGVKVAGKFNDAKQWRSDAQVKAGAYTITVVPPKGTKAELADGAKGLKKVGENKFELIVNAKNKGSLSAVYAQFKLVKVDENTPTPKPSSNETGLPPASGTSNNGNASEYTGFYSDRGGQASDKLSSVEKTMAYEKKYAKALPKTSDVSSAALPIFIAAAVMLLTSRVVSHRA